MKLASIDPPAAETSALAAAEATPVEESGAEDSGAALANVREILFGGAQRSIEQRCNSIEAMVQSTREQQRQEMRAEVLELSNELAQRAAAFEAEIERCKQLIEQLQTSLQAVEQGAQIARQADSRKLSVLLGEVATKLGAAD